MRVQLGLPLVDVTFDLTSILLVKERAEIVSFRTPFHMLSFFFLKLPLPSLIAMYAAGSTHHFAGDEHRVRCRH